MKVIDLLNKIANGEEVPEKIKYKNEIYKRYQNISTNNLYYYQVPNKCKFLIDQLSSAIDLLDEVEIIEESKKIEKLNLPSFEEFETMNVAEHYVATAKEYYVLNELIDEINKLKEEKWIENFIEKSQKEV